MNNNMNSSMDLLKIEDTISDQSFDQSLDDNLTSVQDELDTLLFELENMQDENEVLTDETEGMNENISLQDYTTDEVYTENGMYFPSRIKMKGISDSDFKNLHGTPIADMSTWIKQSGERTCSLATETEIGNQLSDKEYKEEDFINVAKENNWFTDAGGCTEYNVGKGLEQAGFNVTRIWDATFEKLDEVLVNSGKVMAAVNTGCLYAANQDGYPAFSANHIIQVTGIDYSNPNDVKVILNDTDLENGAGVVVDLDRFLKAWECSGNYMVAVYKKEG